MVIEIDGRLVNMARIGGGRRGEPGDQRILAADWSPPP